MSILVWGHSTTYLALSCTSRGWAEHGGAGARERDGKVKRERGRERERRSDEKERSVDELIASKKIKLRRRRSIHDRVSGPATLTLRTHTAKIKIPSTNR